MRALLALLALGALLTLHELAHLLAARIFGTRAVVFSFGIGPPLFGFRALGQRWALGAIPFGGWLRLEGENPHDATRASGVPFAALSGARRLAIFASGPLGSWAVGVGLLTALFIVGTHQPVATEVGAVDPGSMAARAGFRPGDHVLAVDDVPVRRWSDLIEGLVRAADSVASVEVARGGERLVLRISPALDADGRAHVGLRQLYRFERLSLPDAAAGAVRHSGVVLARLVHEAAQVLAALSFGLGLFFLLPLPALDGGRMLLTLWEVARGRPVDARLQTLLQTLSLLAGVTAVAWLAYGEVRQALSLTLLR